MAEQLDLFRFHDLTKQISVAARDGSTVLQGTASELTLEDCEPVLAESEDEVTWTPVHR